MRKDELGIQILDNPREYVTNRRDTLLNTLERIWQLKTPDINADIEEYTVSKGGFFDYKNVFKNSAFIEHMDRRVRADYDRLIRRNADDAFNNIFAT